MQIIKLKSFNYYLFQSVLSGFVPHRLFVNSQVVIHTIRLPKQSTVGDVLDDLKTKVTIATLVFPHLKFLRQYKKCEIMPLINMN